MNVKLYFLHVFVVQVISDEHNDAMTKYGAILAQGIIDAGGRSVTVSLQSRTGHTSVLAVVGMLVFTQYQYWFPLSHFLSLAFQPIEVNGLKSNQDITVMMLKSNTKPSDYSSPPNKNKDNEEKGNGEEKMDVDSEKKDEKKEGVDVLNKKGTDGVFRMIEERETEIVQAPSKQQVFVKK